MKVQQCLNGHFFDADEFGMCPHCGSPVGNGAQAPAKRKEEKVKKKLFSPKRPKAGDTVVLNYNEDLTEIVPENRYPGNNAYANNYYENDYGFSKNEEMQLNPFEDIFSGNTYVREESKEIGVKDDSILFPQKTEFKNNPEPVKQASALEFTQLREEIKRVSAADEVNTMSYFSLANETNKNANKNIEVDPIVGWLVAIKGSHLGESFSLFSGKNSIGRGEDNRVVLSRDNSVSRKKHALIIFEPKKRKFYLHPGESNGLVYLNDDYISEGKELGRMDLIDVGETRLVFVPLCGEEFAWENYMK